MLQVLATYYREFGCGKLGRYNAFRWDNDLQPITHPDPITMDTIIGYDYQKQVLLENTRAFVEGKSANNVMLYGAKGTGKSSSVKALLNQFAAQGLRMVELNRRHLIRENWNDCQRGEEEIFPPDSQQEKLSFAARFGISLVYLSPDQELYLQIVAGMAEKEGIRMGSEDLRRRAIQWELNHQGRSGRSARQFIDDLLAHL